MLLSLFPQILWLAPFSALIIRIALAVVLGMSAWKHVQHRDMLPRVWGILEVAAATALLAGAWTQAVALAVGAGIITGFFFRQYKVFPRSTMLLCIVLCLSLLVTGAGALAFDLPL